MHEDPTVDAETAGAGDVPPFGGDAVDVPRLDRFRVLEVIGEGGFGVVYRAEQTAPIRRQVALKVVKPGMDSRAVVARFEAERQALALMDHPCVAKIFDGGVTERGRPFFAMEFVRGEPITAHCDRQRLGVRDRIALFARACQAVQHAHQKGVVHRDIKPSNILVEYTDGEATPKVIDFGIAKALSQNLTEATLFTGRGEMIGTPEYMSPEQAEASGMDIDTRSDVYSLGVLLYELLTGVRPLDSDRFRTASLVEVQRLIRDETPARPSTAIGTAAGREGVAELRSTEIRSLEGALRADLDWVCMKCLEKDRERRYQTVKELEDDLGRYLRGEAVLAGPPEWTYRARKFVARNRSAVVFAASMVLVVLLGLVGTGAGFAWALDQKGEAERAATAADEARLEAVAQSDLAASRLARSEEFRLFMTGMLGSIDPDVTRPEDSAAIRSLLSDAVTRLESGEVRDVETRIELYTLMGRTASRLGWMRLAAQLFEPALEESRVVYGPRDRRTVRTAISLVIAYLYSERALVAKDLCEEFLGAARALDAEDGASRESNMLSYLSGIHRSLGDLDTSLSLIERSIELQRGRARESYFQTRKAEILVFFGRVEEALEASDRAGAIASRFDLGDSDVWRNTRAQILEALGRYDEAIGLYEAEVRSRAESKPDNPAYFEARVELGYALLNAGREPDALRELSAAWDGLRAQGMTISGHRRIGATVISLLDRLGRADEAARELEAFAEPPGLPLVVYADGTGMPYDPTGRMGETEGMVVDRFCETDPFVGDACLKWRVPPGGSWSGLALLDPEGDWNTLPGGYDLRGCETLTFAARGEHGGETIGVGLGLFDGGAYPDTAQVRRDITLTTEWTRHSIPLGGLDLSRIRAGFVIVSTLSGDERVVYFDDIRIE